MGAAAPDADAAAGAGPRGVGGAQLATAAAGYDPGRERRAEQRARALLRSCVSEHDWEMYRDLGFLRVRGGLGDIAR